MSDGGARSEGAAGTMRRYDALNALADPLRHDLVVTNLANTATEWRALHGGEGNLYCVGMGMVSPWALGLALALPHRQVVALDGDGGILFDPTVLGTMAETGAANLVVVVFDNGGYVSTGRLPTVASQTRAGVSIEALARAYGLAATTETTPEGVARAVDGFRGRGPAVVVARTDASQAFVGAIGIDFKENKYRFVRHVEDLEGRSMLRPSGKEHGAPPPPDPVSRAVSAGRPLAQVLHEGLSEAGVDFATGLPCSGLSATLGRLMADPAIRYVPVAHEGTGVGLCAGAWLGGRRPAALFENFGAFAAAYQLLRGHYSYGVPTLVVVEWRGDAGDQEHFAECGELTLPILSAMRLNHEVVGDLAALKPAILAAWRWMDACLRPFVVVLRYDICRPRSTAPDTR